MKIVVGGFVRVKSKCSANGRTGRVIEVSPWAGLGWLRVEFDPEPRRCGWAILPPEELEALLVKDRPGFGQGSLFEVSP